MIDALACTRKLIVTAMFAVLVTACSSGGGGGGGNTSSDSSDSSDSSSSSSSVDSGAPTATIHFPPARSLTDGDAITVRGTAEDPEGSEVTVVRVNGVDATTDDAFATWSVEIPLDMGENTLTVETGDIATNADTGAATAVIERVADATAGDVHTPDDTNLFTGALRVAVDGLNNRALVTDYNLPGVVAVDLDTGARTVLSDDSTPDDQAPLFTSPEGIAVDPDGARALVVQGNPQVVAVALSDGSRTVFADNSSGGPDLQAPLSVVVDEDNERALIVDWLGGVGISAVSLAGGDKTTVSDGSDNDGHPYQESTGSTMDTTRQPARLLVADGTGKRVIAVSLSDGFQSVLSASDPATPDTETPFTTLQGIALDGANDRALVVDWGYGGVVAVDLGDGGRTVLSGDGVPNTDTPFDSPKGIAVNDTAGQALVVDQNLDAVFAVDLVTGERVILSR